MQSKQALKNPITHPQSITHTQPSQRVWDTTKAFFQSLRLSSATKQDNLTTFSNLNINRETSVYTGLSSASAT